MISSIYCCDKRTAHGTPYLQMCSLLCITSPLCFFPMEKSARPNEICKPSPGLAVGRGFFFLLLHQCLFVPPVVSGRSLCSSGWSLMCFDELIFIYVIFLYAPTAKPFGALCATKKHTTQHLLRNLLFHVLVAASTRRMWGHDGLTNRKASFLVQVNQRFVTNIKASIDRNRREAVEPPGMGSVSEDIWIFSCSPWLLQHWEN